MARLARTAVVTAEIVVPWREDARVVRLTRQIVDLYAKATVKMVTAMVAIGERMAEIHDRLPRGEWVAWVDEAVPLDRRTVSRYIALYEWSERAPLQLERFAHLGPSKHREAELPDGAADELAAELRELADRLDALD